MHAERPARPSRGPGAGSQGSSTNCAGTPPPPPPPATPADLMQSIAMEELAIAHLLNVEAEKVQSVAKQRVTTFTPDEFIAFQHAVAKVLEMVVEKERLLLKKLRLLLSHLEQSDDEDDCCV